MDQNRKSFLICFESHHEEESDEIKSLEVPYRLFIDCHVVVNQVLGSQFIFLSCTCSEQIELYDLLVVRLYCYQVRFLEI
jgi:hypothetical protein